MVRQESTYWEGTSIEKSFKEYSNGVCLINIRYNEKGEEIYYESHLNDTLIINTTTYDYEKKIKTIKCSRGYYFLEDI